MNEDQIFNKRIEQFLKEQPDSNASLLIKLLIDSYPQYQNYHTIFDDFCHKIGLGFCAVESTKSNYYVPTFKYYPDNKLKEDPREEPLINRNLPISYQKTITFLAKEVVYRLMRVRNIEE